MTASGLLRLPLPNTFEVGPEAAFKELVMCVFVDALLSAGNVSLAAPGGSALEEEATVRKFAVPLAASAGVVVRPTVATEAERAMVGSRDTRRERTTSPYSLQSLIATDSASQGPPDPSSSGVDSDTTLRDVIASKKPG